MSTIENVSPENAPDLLKQLAEAVGGKIDDVLVIWPDGHGCATMTMPLPKDHWLTAEGFNEPPVPFLCGTDRSELRNYLKERISVAAKYAIRASTMNGKEPDFDPDAMVQNFIVGMLGVWTSDGRSHL